MTSDAAGEQAKVLAAMIVLHCYAAGEYPADEYDAVERARQLVREYLPTAVTVLLG